ncbi:MAG TPA: hypothetical protein VMT53_15795 [Terriglobales bacterium]|nr:hypothetical protein [Terriglobales bacterium]
MDAHVIEEVVEELISTIEALETRTNATLQFLKAHGIADDEKLAPYLEEAGAASSVKARAQRVRLKHLISSAVKQDERAAKKAQEQSGEKHSSAHADEKRGDARVTQQAAELAKPKSGNRERNEQTQSVSPEPANQPHEKGAESNRDVQQQSPEKTTPNNPSREAA